MYLAKFLPYTPFKHRGAREEPADFVEALSRRIKPE